MKKFYSGLLAFFTLILFVSSANAEDFTKGITLGNVPIDSTSVTSAQLTELSSAAIEKGLRDTQLLGKPSFDKKRRVMTINWHSLTKTIDGTDQSKALTEPLVTQLKLPDNVQQVAVGQDIVIKGDLDSMMEDFDALLAQKSEDSTEINSEKNVSTTNESGSTVGESSNSSGSSGGGYLSEGGLTENQDLEDTDITLDPITSSTEMCSMNIDWDNNVVFEQERVIKTSTETGEITSTGNCYNIGQANKIQKDFAQACNIQINGLDSYSRGFMFYTYINGNRVDLSGCTYDANDNQDLKVSLDYDSCPLSEADINTAEDVFYPAAVKYSMINGTRYNLTECEPITTVQKPLPIQYEECDVSYSSELMTSYKNRRTNIYDPTNKTLLKRGDCQNYKSFAVLKDYEAGCSIQLGENGDYIKGFMLYSNIDNERYEHSACEYDETELKQAEVIKDFDACSLKYASVSAEQGFYLPAFTRYILVNGKRYNLGGCETSVDEKLDLPTEIEQCEFVHSISDLTTYRQEKVNTLDPEGKEVLSETSCYTTEEIPVQRDFDAGCPIQVDSVFGTYTRGYKFFSTVDTKKYVLSECEYNANDAIAYDAFKDYSKCDVELATIDVDAGVYFPQFVKYTLIDNKRYETSGCISEKSDTRDLPTEIRQCEPNYDYTVNIAHDQERVDTLDPEGKTTLKTGDCYSIAQFEIKREYDFDNRRCTWLPDYNNKLIGLGYRNYIVRGEDEEPEYISGCRQDLSNKYELAQEVGECRATENLANAVATINKRWYYFLSDGSMQYVTDCGQSDETYSIIDTQNTCSPVVLEESNKVVMQYRKGWQDSKELWHYVTDCAPTDEETEIHKEFCASPAYEHDLVGGVSYKLSRNYYTTNGKKVYINDCSRDSTVSFSHYKTSEGCTATHDDENLRSRTYSRTLVDLDTGTSVVKGCTASSSYIPYSYMGKTYTAWNGFGSYGSKIRGGYSTSSKSYTPTFAQICERETKSTAYNFNYTKVVGSSTVERTGQSGGENNRTYFWGANISSMWETDSYRRFDNTTYNKQLTKVCKGDN